MPSFMTERQSKAIRDQKRDRQLQGMGLSVFRFAGSEVWRDVFGCARETVGFLKNAVEHERRSHQKKPAAQELSRGLATRAAGE